jgi:hypothetical protein
VRVPGLALVGLAVACSHPSPVEEPAPLQTYVCSGSMRPPWGDRDEVGATRPFRFTVEASSPGQALTEITANARRDWNHYHRSQDLNQQIPPFPGLIGASCVAEAPLRASPDSPSHRSLTQTFSP